MVEVSVHLIEHRGLAGAALAVQYDDVVLVLANQSAPDELEDIVAAEEHLGPGHGAPRDVWIAQRLSLGHYENLDFHRALLPFYYSVGGSTHHPGTGNAHNAAVRGRQQTVKGRGGSGQGRRP